MPEHMEVALALTYHDSEGRLYDQLMRVWPKVAELFGAVTIRATYNTHPASLDYLRAAGARVECGSIADHEKIGLARRRAVELALEFGCPSVMYCDADRVLHWAEFYSDELASLEPTLQQYDFTILGRTPRAYETHPRVQRDTEAIINHVYMMVSGYNRDITAAARGLSRRAAEAIVPGCPDDQISTDASWPLFIQRSGRFSVGYLQTEGLEFETADRFAAEIAQVGGLANWMAQIDADPRHWAQRLDLARVEVEAMQVRR